MTHVPVLTAEVLAHAAARRSGGLFVDCTVGLGGHSRALLEAGASRIIGFDRDLDALARARDTLAPWSDRVELVHADYRAIAEVLDSRQIAHVDGALADLGVSSMQFDAAGPRLQLSARRAARHAHGSQPAAKPRPIWSRTSSEARSRRRDFPVRRGALLAPHRARDRRGAPRGADRDHRRGWRTIVRRAVPHRGGHMRIDPATRTFQALRIWVNRELDGLDRFLERRRGACAPARVWR